MQFFFLVYVKTNFHLHYILFFTVCLNILLTCKTLFTNSFNDIQCIVVTVFVTILYSKQKFKIFRIITKLDHPAEKTGKLLEADWHQTMRQRSLKLYRQSADQSYGFTIRHMAIYPPVVQVSYKILFFPFVLPLQITVSWTTDA